MERRAKDAAEKIKEAVKEALNDKRMEDLATQLTNIATQMTEGFAKSHTRHDIANGKLMAHQARFDLMDGEKKGGAGYEKFLWLIITTLTGLVVYFIK